MPGKFINEITGDVPAKDDLAVFFDKSKNSTAQATIAEMVNAGLDLAAGAKGQVPTIDVKVDAATSSLVNILTWGAGGGVDFKGTPTRPPAATDEILTNDPVNGLVGKTTLQQLVVAGGATILQPGTAVNTALVWNDTAGKWEPARAVSEAVNINGGKTGELPFQLNTHVTAWVPLGNAGQVLTIGDIGTAGNPFIAPMWMDPVKELPAFTIADKGKQLTVKADGKATEWETAASGLPSHTAANQGQRLAVNLDGTGVEWSKTYMDATEAAAFTTAVWAKTGVVAVDCPTFLYRFHPTGSGGGITSLTLNGVMRMGSAFTNLGISIPSNTTLTTFSAPHLTGCVMIKFTNCSALTTVKFDAIDHVAGAIQFSNCTELTSLVFYAPARQCAAGIFIASSPKLTTLTIPFRSVEGNISITLCTTLSSVVLSSFRNSTGNFIVTDAALTIASVEAILASLAGMDGTSGSSIYGKGKTVNLSGGTSAGLATLSAVAITDKDTLVARGCTVTLNP